MTPNLCVQLLLLASELSGLPKAEQCPDVQQMHSSQLQAEVCGQPGCSVIAYYDRERRTILLDQAENLDFAYSRSILLHELVHYLQDIHQQWHGDECQAVRQRETQAFRAQELYLQKQGYPLPISNKLRFYHCDD